MKFFDFLKLAHTSNTRAIYYLITELLLYEPLCTKCRRPCIRVRRRRHIYCCNRSTASVRCNTTMSVLTKSLFENSVLSIYTIFSMIDAWRKGVIQEIISEDLEVSQATVSFWYSKLDSIVAWRKNSFEIGKIGGDGMIVELDECLAVKRKYHRGRILRNQVWIFGGVERGNAKRYFIEVVENRRRSTLLDVIRRRVNANSIIMTDLWKGYENMTVFLFEENFLHYTVNHSRNFVDPLTGAHTQSIEGFWSVYKRVVRRRGTNVGSITRRINIFHVFRFLKDNRRDAFDRILDLLRDYTVYEL